MLENPDPYLRYGPSGMVLAVVVVCFTVTMSALGLFIRSLSSSTKAGVRQLALLNKTGEGLQHELREVRQNAADGRQELRDSRFELTHHRQELSDRLGGIERGIERLAESQHGQPNEDPIPPLRDLADAVAELERAEHERTDREHGEQG